MTMVTATSVGMNLRPLSPSSPIPIHNLRHVSSITTKTTSTRSVQRHLNLKCISAKEYRDNGKTSRTTNSETILHSFSPFPLLYAATLLPGSETARVMLEPFVELTKWLNVPDWIIHYGHPTTMTMVLVAIGGYGTYLGFRIRHSNDTEEKAKAKELHPKLLGGMFFMFGMAAIGGLTSLIILDIPIFDSPHAVTAIIGLALLTIQSNLPSLFEGNQGLRSVHGILGSGIMTLFIIHAALGIPLLLSFFQF